MHDDVKKFISISSWLVALQLASLAMFVGAVSFLYVNVQGIRQDLKANNTGGSATATNVKDWRQLIRPHNASRGSENAKIVVVEFTDFQCPYCRRFHDTTERQLRSKYGDRIRLVFKHFPLEQIHEHAKQAAVAAQCAGREGNFWQTEDTLFENQEKLSPETMIKIGKDLGLGSSFERCVQNQASVTEVEEDIEDGMHIGIRGTPTFLINGKVVAGAMPLDRWEAMIDKAL